MKRSILDLSPTDLEAILQSKRLPEDVTLKGIEERDDFEILYRHRNNPAKLAEYLLSLNKGDGYIQKQRLELKKQELELRKEKQKGQTFLLKDLKSHLTRLETKLDYLLTLQTEKR